MTRIVLLVCVVVGALPVLTRAQKADVKASDNYNELVARYLETARAQAAGPAAEPYAWMNGLMADLRARRVNDLVTINISENLTASGTADSTLSKSSGADIGVPSLFGLEKKLPGIVTPASLAAAKAETGFSGAGATMRAGSLSAIVTARVSEVLANGDLLLEGVREIEINGDRQIVVLTGVARVADVGPGNVVSSAALGQLRIRYFGRGLIKDSLSPGWLVRLLNKVF